MFWNGTRVKLTEKAAHSGTSRYGIPRGKSLTEAIGTVKGNVGNLVDVLWDGAKETTTLAPINLQDARR